MNQLQLLAGEIVHRHAEWTARWHETFTPPEAGAPRNAIERNHRMNFDLWQEEDIARREDLSLDQMRDAKRAIDHCNQARNDAVEQMDVWLLGQLPPANPDSPLHSETPGMIIDRLSILSLKVYHMRLEAGWESATEEHRRKCADRCAILEEQLRDQGECFQVLLAGMERGTRRFKLYRQLKMYNDASLNPQLYSHPQPAK